MPVEDGGGSEWCCQKNKWCPPLCIEDEGARGTVHPALSAPCIHPVSRHSQQWVLGWFLHPFPVMWLVSLLSSAACPHCGSCCAGQHCGPLTVPVAPPIASCKQLLMAMVGGAAGLPTILVPVIVVLLSLLLLSCCHGHGHPVLVIILSSSCPHPPPSSCPHPLHPVLVPLHHPVLVLLHHPVIVPSIILSLSPPSSCHYPPPLFWSWSSLPLLISHAVFFTSQWGWVRDAGRGSHHCCAPSLFIIVVSPPFCCCCPLPQSPFIIISSPPSTLVVVIPLLIVLIVPSLFSLLFHHCSPHSSHHAVIVLPVIPLLFSSLFSSSSSSCPLVLALSSCHHCQQK
jgi:hypothetical protein